MSATDSPPPLPPSTEAQPTAAPSDPSTTTSPPPTIPNLRTISDPSNTASTNPLNALNAARRPPVPPFSPSSPVVPTTTSTTTKVELPKDAKDMQAILKAFHQKRQGAAAPALSTSSPVGGAFIGGAFNPTASPRLNRPNAPSWQSSPAAAASPPTKQGLGFRRGLKLPGGLPGAAPPTGSGSGSGPTGNPTNGADSATGSLFNKFSNYVDTATGSLKFAGKAVIHGKGVDFSSGSTFRISLDELESLDELGKGNYGTVYKVIHRKPKLRVPGAGVAAALSLKPTSENPTPNPAEDERLTGVVMAMKEIRLELDEAKFAAIIMELDILHRCVSPYIIDFYGAFFQEGAVYICIEWMDGGSMDKLYGDGVPEHVLKKITWATIMGLKYLKEEHNIIHRDVKPTNILVNTKGDVKLCDFGVSGNLVASIAKTNIGCQSYMAPERIATGTNGVGVGVGSKDGTYSVQSDIWSLGLSILECAMGRYPYPPETYNNIFSQLSAIVDGPPPDLPDEGFSPQARDFVRRTLHKVPKMRPTYAALLQHPWFSEMQPNQTIAEEDEEEAEREGGETNAEAPPTPQPTRGFPEVREWVVEQLKKREEKLREGGKWGGAKPALHSVALDKVVSPVRETVRDGAEGLVDGVEGLTVNS